MLDRPASTSRQHGARSGRATPRSYADHAIIGPGIASVYIFLPTTPARRPPAMLIGMNANPRFLQRPAQAANWTEERGAKISARGQRRDGAENAGSEQESQPPSSRLFGFWRPLPSALAPSLIKSAAAFACRRIFSSRAGLTRRFVSARRRHGGSLRPPPAFSGAPDVSVGHVST